MGRYSACNACPRALYYGLLTFGQNEIDTINSSDIANVGHNLKRIRTEYGFSINRRIVSK